MQTIFFHVQIIKYHNHTANVVCVRARVCVYHLHLFRFEFRKFHHRCRQKSKLSVMFVFFISCVFHFTIYYLSRRHSGAVCLLHWLVDRSLMLVSCIGRRLSRIYAEKKKAVPSLKSSSRCVHSKSRQFYGVDSNYVE